MVTPFILGSTSNQGPVWGFRMFPPSQAQHKDQRHRPLPALVLVHRKSEEALFMFVRTKPFHHSLSAYKEYLLRTHGQWQQLLLTARLLERDDIVRDTDCMDEPVMQEAHDAC